MKMAMDWVCGWVLLGPAREVEVGVAVAVGLELDLFAAFLSRVEGRTA